MPHAAAPTLARLAARAQRRPRAAAAAAAARTAASAAAPPAPLPRWARYTPCSDAAKTPRHATEPTNNDDVLVLLVGWLGCRRAYLDRYEALYASRGLATLAVLPPVSATLAPPLADAAAAAFLAAAPQRLRGPRQRTLLHVASNGGFLFLSQLLRAAALPDAARSPAAAAAAAALAASTRGLLLDCAPAVITPDVVARALAALAARGAASAAPPPRALRAACARYLALPPVACRLAELGAVWGGDSDSDAGDATRADADESSSKKAHAALLGTLRRAPPALAVPTACLYSADDALVPPADVERWAAQRAAAGTPAPALRLFRDAPHVELLRHHPAQYDAAVGEWLEAALRSSASG